MTTTEHHSAEQQEYLLAEGLKKSYGKRNVVKDVSIRVNPGEIVGLLGPNGAGKTTCFYMIVGLISADAGSILLNSEKITRQAIHQRAAKGLSYLPQEPSVFRKLSVEQNILAVLELQKRMTKSAKKEQLEMLLEELQITHIRKNLAGPLSGGERRRVEIARALATNPHFILLDEPFAGVDPIVVIEIQRIIGFLKKKNIGVLITDHNVRETLRICDKAYIINDGVVLASGTPDDIVTNPTVRKVYLGEHFQM